ncbi:YetF domain-containing protein [Blastomonas sp. AAP53]|uniref:DUF421 domain-containing protein n=1 Tax=Blastomonas sp. AAP53 TaxID=1248760 RepID=UPI000373DBE1|nr:YetF domain-containing protein [Blastomonas sp. AAP53]
MLFDGFYDLARVAGISLLAYVSLIIVLRLAGKRSLAKLNAFDLVVTVALGSTFATVLLSSDVAFLEGLLAFAALALLQWGVSRLSVAWPAFRNLVRSQPRLLLEDGEFLMEAANDERITQDELLAAVRSAGVGRLEDVAAVVLETDGSLSVIKRADQPLTVLGSVRR